MNIFVLTFRTLEAIERQVFRIENCASFREAVERLEDIRPHIDWSRLVRVRILPAEDGQ